MHALYVLPLPFLAPDTHFDWTQAGTVHLWLEAINPKALLPLERVLSTGRVWLFPAATLLLPSLHVCCDLCVPDGDTATATMDR